MANYNLTNQPISASFQQLLQKNDNDFLVDGTGSLVETLKVTGSVSSSTYYGDGSNLTGVSTDTGSFVTTSSFDNGTRIQTFTKGDGSTYTNSIPDATVSTGSLLVTASVVDATITYTKGDGSTFTNTVNNVVNATSSSHADFADETDDVILNVKNTSGVDIGKGLAVHATGVTGENVNIKLADSSVSGDMPAIGITRDAISNNASGVVILSGKVRGLNTATDGLVAGAAVYVNGAGVLTSTKPTGSDLIQNIGICGKVNATDGEIIVVGSGRSNDLPNITDGYGWFGNNNGVPTAQTTASFAKTDIDNTFSGTQNFLNISVSGTGSFGRINSVTGSAKIIGDAFVVVNADTPTLRYAGLQVYDSGSSATASIEWDGGNDSWILVEEGGQSSFILTGPTGSKGSEVDLTNNTIPKAGVHRQLIDSIITDNGSTVSIGGNLNVTGNYNGFDSSSFALKNAANTFTEGPQIASASDGNGYFTSKPTMPTTSFIQKNLWEANGQNLSVLGNGDYNVVQESLTHLQGYGRWYDGSWYQEFYNSSFTDGAEVSLNGGGWRAAVAASGSSNSGQVLIQDNYDGNTQFQVDANIIKIGTGGGGSLPQAIVIGSISAPVNINTSGISIDSIGVIGITGSVDISDNLSLPGISNVSESIASASVSGGGGASGIFEQTGSFYSTTNDLQVTGSFGVSKAIGGKNSDLTITSNTASIDLTQSNTYTVTLVSSADTHLDVSTFGEDAQSVNVLVKQPAAGNTGSISFSPDFKFGQGYSYKPTPSNSSEDILSFTRFGNSLYGTYINNFN